MIACYIRVSTDDQSLENQKRELRAWLKSQSISEENVTWYEDIYTGNTLARKAFQKLLLDISNGKVNTVVCWKLDRLSRSMREGMELIQDWSSQGLRVVSTTQQIDMSGIMGKMIANIFFAFAEMEQEMRRERIKIGVSRAKAEGKYKGRKPGTFVVDPKKAHKLLDQGLSIRKTAKLLDVSPTTVAKYAKQREQYTNSCR